MSKLAQAQTRSLNQGSINKVRTERSYLEKKYHGLSKDPGIRGEIYQSFLNARCFCKIHDFLEIAPEWSDDPVQFTDDVLELLGNPEFDTVLFPEQDTHSYILKRIDEGRGWFANNLTWKKIRKLKGMEMGKIKSNKSPVFKNNDLTLFGNEKWDINFTEHASTFTGGPKYYRFKLTYDGDSVIRGMFSPSEKVLLADNIYLDIRNLYSKFDKEITGWGYIKKIK